MPGKPKQSKLCAGAVVSDSIVGTSEGRNCNRKIRIGTLLFQPEPLLIKILFFLF